LKVKHFLKKILTTLIVSSVMLLGVFGCRGETSEESNLGVRAREVSVSPVALRDFERKIVTTGSLQPRSQAMIRAITEGPLEVVSVEIGDRVSAGQVLFQVRLIDAELTVKSAEAGLRIAEAALADLLAWQRPEEVQSQRERLSQAQAEHERLARDRERMETLFERGSISQSEWDMARTAADSAAAALASTRQQLNIAESGPTQEQIAVVRAQVAQAEAALAQVRQILQDAIVRAPFDGVVTQRLKKSGDFVNRAEPVVEIADITLLEAEMRVPELYARLIQQGASLDIVVESIGEKRPGTVFAISESIDPATRTFQVKVEVDNSDRMIKAGMFCLGEFHLPTKSNVPAVLNGALVQEEGRYYVWVADNTTAKRIEVEVGEREGEYREIVSGVEPGIQVIIGGKGALTEGTEIVIRENLNSTAENGAE